MGILLLMASLPPYLIVFSGGKKMKSSTTTIISAIIAIGAVFLTYYLNNEKVDIRYTLSENIPVTIAGQKFAESIQQLDVKNIGNSEAQRITVKINGQITKYELIKNSQADFVQSFKEKDYLELIYSNLPPEGNFKLVFNSPGIGIKTDDIVIKHNKGKGIEALTRTPFAIYSLFLLLFYIIIVITGIRTVLTDSWESKARYSNQDDVIKRNRKPFYISSEKWDCIYEEALDKKAINGYIRLDNIESNDVYKVLSHDKPDYLSKENWHKLLDKAIEAFSDAMLSLLGRIGYSPTALQLLSVKKPENFPEARWNDMRKQIQEKYIALKKLEIAKYDSLSNININELKNDKPQEIESNYWLGYYSLLQKEYSYQVNRELEFADNPMELLMNLDISFLDHDVRVSLERRAYSNEIRKLSYRNNILNDIDEAQRFICGDKPKWIRDDDYRKLVTMAQKIVELDKLIKKNRNIFEMLEKIIENKSLPNEKPEFLGDKDWISLQKVLTEIRTALYNKQQVSELKGKIERQLEIINTFINDPSVLDRVEEYNNVFAPGNFENLKKLALMKKAKQDSLNLAR
jgi:hypothetical protein